MEQQRLDAPVFEFWYLVGDDLGQHLREFHAEGFIHKGVEADLEKALHHLGERGGGMHPFLNSRAKTDI